MYSVLYTAHTYTFTQEHARRINLPCFISLATSLRSEIHFPYLRFYDKRQCGSFHFHYIIFLFFCTRQNHKGASVMANLHRSLIFESNSNFGSEIHLVRWLSFFLLSHFHLPRQLCAIERLISKCDVCADATHWHCLFWFQIKIDLTCLNQLHVGTYTQHTHRMKSFISYD